MWDVFTRPEGWETWWGGRLNAVDPGWEEGASLNWDLGGSSTIVAIAPMERVEVTASAPPGVGQGTTDSFTFTDQGPTSTRVEYEQDSGSMAFGDPGAAQRESSACMTRLKAYVEQAAGPGESGDVTATLAERPWSKFMGFSFRRPNVAKLRANRDVPGLLEALQHTWNLGDALGGDYKGWAYRTEAAVALGELGDESAVEPLIHALSDKSGAVQGAAARALASLGAEDALRAIAEDPNRDAAERDRARNALEIAAERGKRAAAPATPSAPVAVAGDQDAEWTDKPLRCPKCGAMLNEQTPRYAYVRCGECSASLEIQDYQIQVQ